MNILHVISSLGKTQGGTSEVIPRMCEALVAEGASVRILTCEYGELSAAAIRAQKAGVEIRVYDRTGIRGRVLRYSGQMRSEIDAQVQWADVVHLHGLWQWPCWMAGWAAQRNKKPYVMMPHGFLEPERLKISRWKKRIVGLICERPLLSRSNGIVATSENELAGIRQYGIDRSAHIMPIGLDLEPYKISSNQGKALLYFSRITPIKGLDMLAEVWGRIDRKGWKLLIVGPDDRGYTEEIKTLFALKCPVGSYEFRPPVFGVDKFKLLQSVDAMVLPTRSENWSIAVAEGMASGLPVVCTKGAPWECLNAAKAGWWVDVSADSIRQGLESLLALSDNDRHEMGLRGRKWVEDNLAWGRIAADMINFYRRFI